VIIRDLTPKYAEYFKVEPFSGVLIEDVLPGSPAAEALQREDIILSVDGQPVTKTEELIDAIQYRQVGETVTLEVLRKGQRLTVQITLAERPSDEELARLNQAPSSATTEPMEAFGLRVQPNSPELARQLGLRITEGVVITEVQPGSPADFAGLQPGEVIVAVNNRAIRTVEDWNEAVTEAQGQQLVALRILQGNVQRLVILSP
jgi:serine protease Do